MGEEDISVGQVWHTGSGGGGGSTRGAQGWGVGGGVHEAREAHCDQLGGWGHRWLWPNDPRESGLWYFDMCHAVVVSSGPRLRV